VIKQVRDWLPTNAFTDEALKAAFVDLVKAWSQRWFASAQIAVTSTGLAATPAATRVAVDWSDAGRKHVLEAALGIDLAEQSLTDRDRAVLDAFASKIVEDLLDTLQRSGPREVVDEMTARATLAVNQLEVLTILLPHSCLVAAIKVRTAKSNRSTRQLSNRLKAVGPAKVQVEGILGQTDLALSEVETLGVGDVLILNRTLGQNVELRLKDVSRLIGRGRLGRSSELISIQF
jgi:flagellar motor switch/type III secretory pathway protein FliN